MRACLNGGDGVLPRRIIIKMPDCSTCGAPGLWCEARGDYRCRYHWPDRNFPPLTGRPADPKATTPKPLLLPNKQHPRRHRNWKLVLAICLVILAVLLTFLLCLMVSATGQPTRPAAGVVGVNIERGGLVWNAGFGDDGFTAVFFCVPPTRLDSFDGHGEKQDPDTDVVNAGEKIPH